MVYFIMCKSSFVLHAVLKYLIFYVYIDENLEMCVFDNPNPLQEECFRRGKKFDINDHNVKVEIPQGAIEKGDTVEVKVAASLFGPHKLPKGYTRISAYVWIGGAGYRFKKPLKIEVEHHAILSKEDDISQLCVLESCMHNEENEMCEATNTSSSQYEIGSGFYTYIQIDHTYSKYTCLAKKSREIADEVAVYQFLPKNYVELDNFTVEICFCCNLKFLRKVSEL